MNSVLGGWVDRIASWARTPADTADEALQKGAITLASLTIMILATAWVGMYAALGLYTAAAIPLIYQILSAFGLVVFVRFKGLALFRFGQLLLMLFLPFMLQWTLGGFVKAGGVMVWAFVAPIGGLIFQGPVAGAGWFAGYAALTLLSGALDPSVAAIAPPVPPIVSVIWFVMNIGAVSLVTFLLLQYFARERQRALGALNAQHRLLQEEQARSESLLLNILPRRIAERLKRDSSAIADRFPEVTVLFADIADFTSMSATMSPEVMVGWLNELFSRFDLLSDRYGLEKIKTIGDAYMAVAGLPTGRPDHAEAAAEMALAMQRELESRFCPNGDPVRMRIGLHCGPVVAGVIGARKFIYDLWGDTVNTASRMESTGLAGVIQVTEQAYERLRHEYTFAERGRIQVKGKGEMRTWLLLGRRSDAP
jgi:class 3 adenylate cyclase